MIRYANINDVARINELGENLHNNFSRLFKLNDMLNEGYTKILVYVEEKTIVGFLIATCLYETVDILSIYVDPNYRRRHVASNLIDYLLGEVEETVKVMTLEVAVDNHSAINLYKKFGFEVINIRKNYYKEKDGYLMGRSFTDEKY